MRDKPGVLLEKSRMRTDLVPFLPGSFNGAFMFKGGLRVIASDSTCEGSEGWEHVSVSLATRCPTWEEMCFVKALFWKDDEVVFQLHPAKDKWISNHPYCLHMWRKIDADPPLPPGIFVGIQQDGEYRNRAEALAGYKRAQARGEIP